ncbi:MAG: sialate O-acetylesterase [Bacteroidales bacterium]|nr:sialate O-acetylesterase [Bacteroidales bacterium]
MKKIFALMVAAVASVMGLAAQEIVPVWITIGQSNADGSAYADAAEDARLDAWYSSPSNPQLMKIWYRSSEIQNQPDGSRWVFDGQVEDAQPGWMDLWYKNDNANGRTAMNMIHSYGTYSTGGTRDKADGRRGMEGQFGMRFQEAFPTTPLYIIKLGASGSAINTWADATNDHNWRYFYDNVYRPAIDSLLAEGKRPQLVGIWWMQGCGDGGREEQYYERRLNTLMERLRCDLGFPNAPVYIGDIVRPGESEACPKASTQFGMGVRKAKETIASQWPGVEIIHTQDCTLQDDNLHFDHPGINKIGDKLADRAIASQTRWALFSTPGEWNGLNGNNPTFKPYVGNPEITYSIADGVVTATLKYPTWTETISTPLTR